MEMSKEDSAKEEPIEKQGYQYIYVPNIAPDSEISAWQSFREVIRLPRIPR